MTITIHTDLFPKLLIQMNCCAMVEKFAFDKPNRANLGRFCNMYAQDASFNDNKFLERANKMPKKRAFVGGIQGKTLLYNILFSLLIRFLILIIDYSYPHKCDRFSIMQLVLLV